MQKSALIREKRGCQQAGRIIEWKVNVVKMNMATALKAR